MVGSGCFPYLIEWRGEKRRDSYLIAESFSRSHFQESRAESILWPQSAQGEQPTQTT